jgi:ribosomal protein S18 acetylase RimI-like enzyme
MIRPITCDDLDALKSVVDATGLFPSQLLDEMTAAFLAGQASEEVWLTDDENGPLGLAYCAPERMTQGTWNLYLIAIAPQHQSQGRGGALLRAVESRLPERGAHLLLVETSGDPSFERAQEFYRCHGFSEEARIHDFYQRGEDKIVFRKALL